MRNLVVRPLFLAALAGLFMATAAQACSRAAVNGADRAVPSGKAIDAALVDRAIRSEVNYYRCKAGLQPLGEAGGLRKVATTHAKWMARARTLTHKSSVSGQKTPKSRLKVSGVRFRAGAENIGVVARYQFEGAQFRIKSMQSCHFTTSGGAQIPPHTYASLARHIVQLWMASSGHRRNILDRKMTRLGSGAGFDKTAPNCGKLYVSQTFAG